VSIGVGGGLGSKAGGAEAGDFDGEGLIDIPCESEAEFFQSIHFPDDFWAEGGFGASKGLKIKRTSKFLIFRLN
jgi:hypothetical protein